MAPRIFTLRRRPGTAVTPEEMATAERFEEELNLIAEQVRAEHPGWSARQVFDETRRRMTMTLN